MARKIFIHLFLLGWLGLTSALRDNVLTAKADGNNTLAPFYSVKLYGDVTSAGVGLRGSGTGNIVITDIPTGATVSNAFLYWATLGDVNTYTSPTLAGNLVAGELIGTSGDTCWGAAHNYVYRADVTALVQGNGTYMVAGLPGDLTTGNDSQGASLVVIYNHAGLYRTVLINDGAVTLDFVQRSFTDTLTGFTADQPEAQAHITYLVGDGQTRWNSGSVLFEGVPMANNVFNGADGDYWGTVTFDVTGLVTEPSSTTTIDNTNPGDPGSPDCLLWAATVFSVETEPPVFDYDYVLYLPLLRQ